MIEFKKAEFPLVTIATLCYNTGKFVIESLECVKRQNYPNIQHIIIDDCSTDDSVKLIENWIKLNHHSCQFIKHKVNQGVQDTLREIFELSTGKYFAAISDDLWTDNKLLKQVEIFENLDESYALIYGDMNVIDKNGTVLTPSVFDRDMGKDFVPPCGDIFREVVKDFYFYIQTSMIRLSHFEKMNYKFSSKIISEDWDWELWLSRNYNVMGMKEIYGSYRLLETSVTRINWAGEKKLKTWLSHARMLLKYYNNAKNNIDDKEIIFQRIWRIYTELKSFPNFNLSAELMILSKIFLTTRKRFIFLMIFKITILKYFVRIKNFMLWWQ